MPPLTLADLDKSPERYILEAVATKLRGNTLLADCFKPIRVLENPTREAFLNFGVGTLSIQPYQVTPTDKPSQRSTVHFGVMISAFLASEQREEDSDLVGLDLGSHLRVLLWGLAVTHPSYPSPISFATTEFRPLTPLIVNETATRILSYQAIFETDVDPVQGDFSA